MNKRTPRTKLTNLTGTSTIDEADLKHVIGAVTQITKWSMTPPTGPDDIYRIDDH